VVVVVGTCVRISPNSDYTWMTFEPDFWLWLDLTHPVWETSTRSAANTATANTVHNLRQAWRIEDAHSKAFRAIIGSRVQVRITHLGLRVNKTRVWSRLICFAPARCTNWMLRFSVAYKVKVKRAMGMGVVLICLHSSLSST